MSLMGNSHAIPIMWLNRAAVITQRPRGGADASWAAAYFESTPWHPPVTPFPFLFAFTEATSNATGVCAARKQHVKAPTSADRFMFLQM
jgi:hypothetical protein